VSFADFCEKLLTARPSDISLERTSDVRRNPIMEMGEKSDFSIKHRFTTCPDQSFEVYSIMGLKFLIIGEKGFVFDRAHLLHLRECSQKIATYQEFASVHRVVGATPRDCLPW
jgi:hypothetical protein